MYFNNNIIYLCTKLKISQNNLATELKIPPSSIKNIFQGKVKSINLEYAYKISKYLEVDLTDMIEKDFRKDDQQE